MFINILVYLGIKEHSTNPPQTSRRKGETDIQRDRIMGERERQRKKETQRPRKTEGQ
jgi:hypothetical protein